MQTDNGDAMARHVRQCHSAQELNMARSPMAGLLPGPGRGAALRLAAAAVPRAGAADSDSALESWPIGSLGPLRKEPGPRELRTA
jgi:hypothetical protein